ncbi:hypothetical protein [Paraburkholderia sediminicola]|uniref:hypothetical protein n=1 Tax=Paraburkholderia sediminicola TaxID=458836 RepID=UPI0038BD8184
MLAAIYRVIHFVVSDMPLFSVQLAQRFSFVVPRTVKPSLPVFELGLSDVTELRQSVKETFSAAQQAQGFVRCFGFVHPFYIALPCGFNAFGRYVLRRLFHDLLFRYAPGWP